MNATCTDTITEEIETYINKRPLSTTHTYIMTIDTIVVLVHKMLNVLQAEEYL